MRFNRIVLLKTSQQCLIRNAGANDAQEVHDLFNITHGQTDYLLSYPDENSFNVEQERNFLHKKEDSENEI